MRGRSAIGSRKLRLLPGRHASPGEGVCVVELASLLADERFSDRPRCVCPVIAAFLRGWNDLSPYASRQNLEPYAARIVGSREGSRVTHERRDLCLEWIGADLRHGWLRRTLTRLGMRARIAVFCGPLEAIRLNEGAGAYAARVVFGGRDVEGAFVLLDAMLALGTRSGKPRTPPPAPPRPAVPDEGWLPASGDLVPTPPANGNGHAEPVPANGNGRMAPAPAPIRSNGNGSAASQPPHPERVPAGLP